MSGPVAALTVVAALGCGLVAGVLFAFSSFVMPALGRLPVAQGIAAMQSINRSAVTPAFMAALFGAAAACIAVAVAAVVSWGDGWAVWALAGGALYAAGTIGLTIAYHVPRNDALADVDASEPDAAGRWAAYLSGWTAWNHVRGAAALGAAAALTAALLVG